MATLLLEINGEQVEVDLTFDKLSLREAVQLEKVLGEDGWKALTEGELRPSIVQALLFVKLRKYYPDLTVDDFDLPFEALTGASEEDDSGNV
jgi:hypothetical protein